MLGIYLFSVMMRRMRSRLCLSTLGRRMMRQETVAGETHAATLINRPRALLPAPCEETMATVEILLKKRVGESASLVTREETRQERT
jgi:hypothetical protein